MSSHPGKCVFCISFYFNIHGKGKNSAILPAAMGKIVGQTGIFNLDIYIYITSRHEQNPTQNLTLLF